MTIEHHFIHRCTLQTATTAVSAIGELQETWADHQVDVECRFVVKEQTIADEQRSQHIITTYKLIVSRDAVVSDHMRVTDVVDLDDVPIDAGPFKVIGQMPRRARTLRHTTLRLERID